MKGFLDVVPPIFDACTATLTSRDEERARDLYWGVVQNTSSLSDADALASLDEAARLRDAWNKRDHHLKIGEKVADVRADALKAVEKHRLAAEGRDVRLAEKHRKK